MLAVCRLAFLPSSIVAKALPLLTTRIVEDTQPKFLDSSQYSGALCQHQHVRHRKKRFYKTMSRRFDGHLDLYNDEGERDPLMPAVERYKRLDWGQYIGTIPGRFNKLWRKTDVKRWQLEQHIMVPKGDNVRLERMFTGSMKRPRFYVDDPYLKYNKMSFLRHHYTLLKNSELIRRQGNEVYLFDRYKAHMKKRASDNQKPTTRYMPPDYLETIGNSPCKTYQPDEDERPPEVKTVPHFQRKRLMSLHRAKRNKKFREYKDYEQYVDEPLPIWSPLRFPFCFPR